MSLVPKTIELVRAQGQDDVRFIVGGIIPDEDVPRLKEMGVLAIFGPGTSTHEIIAVVNEVTGVQSPE